MTICEVPLATPTPKSNGRRVVLGGLVGVVVMLLIAHGCHGPDEDLEPSILMSPSSDISDSATSQN